MTDAAARAEADRLMAAIQERVIERAVLERSISGYPFPRERRRVRERLKAIRKANRADSLKFGRLDREWEASHAALAS